MNNKRDQSKDKFLRMKIILLFFLLFFPLIVGCEANQRIIAIIAAVQNYFLDKEEEPISSDFIEMTATGQFLLLPESNLTYTGNEITLHWNVNWRTGEVKSRVWGEGVWNTVAGNTWCNLALTFEGTISADGQTFTGTIHSIGSQGWEAGGENLDYYTNWTATRRGDTIEGLADGLGGPFSLTVLPAQYPEPGEK